MYCCSTRRCRSGHADGRLRMCPMTRVDARGLCGLLLPWLWLYRVFHFSSGGWAASTAPFRGVVRAEWRMGSINRAPLSWYGMQIPTYQKIIAHTLGLLCFQRVFSKSRWGAHTTKEQENKIAKVVALEKVSSRCFHGHIAGRTQYDLPVVEKINSEKIRVLSCALFRRYVYMYICIYVCVSSVGPFSCASFCRRPPHQLAICSHLFAVYIYIYAVNLSGSLSLCLQPAHDVLFIVYVCTCYWEQIMYQVYTYTYDSHSSCDIRNQKINTSVYSLVSLRTASAKKENEKQKI